MQEAEASVIFSSADVSDCIHELCQNNVDLWINIFYCEDIANPSLGLKTGINVFLLVKHGWAVELKIIAD